MGWGSPEAVHGLVFSEASDVWSVGVTCWEVFANGKMPWPGENNNSTMLKIRKGKRMKQPKSCPSDVWSVLLFTWQKEPNDRPSFTQLGEMFQKCFKKYCLDTSIRDIGILATKSKKGAKGAYALASSANDMYASTNDITAPGGGEDDDSPYAWGFNETEEDTSMYGTP